LYEINKQCDSCMDVLEVALDPSGNFNIFIVAVERWSNPGAASSNMGIITDWLGGADFYTIFTMECDWAMIEYEYNKQASASGAY